MNSKNINFDLSDFLERQVFPALWACLSTAFPEFGFRNKGNYWQATDETATRLLPGSPRPSRVYAYFNSPYGFTIQGGDFIPWLSYICGGITPRGKDFIAAVRTLADLAGVSLPITDFTDEKFIISAAKELQHNLLEDFFSYTRKLLFSNTGKPATNYLKKRGFSIEEIENLELGFYSTAKDITTFLLSKDYSANEIGYSAYEVENLAKPIGSAIIYDGRWENRLIGVWRSRTGRIINFWTRDLTNKTKEHEKYLMLKGGSKKSPFGLDKTQGKDLILVEGFLDVLSLNAFGIMDVVALGGASLSMDQIQTLEQTAIKSLTLNLDYDADKTCKHNLPRPDCLSISCNSTLAALEMLKNANFQVFVIAPKEMQVISKTANKDEKIDPDSFIRSQGVEKYKKLLANKIHAYRYKAQTLIEKHHSGTWTDSNKISLLDEAIEFAASVIKKEVELDLFFWPEIFAVTKTDPSIVADRLKVAKENKILEKERLAFQQLIIKADKTLKDYGPRATKSFLKEQLTELEVENLNSILPISQEIEAHTQLLSEWQGKEFIGLPQKSLPTLDKATLGLRGLMLLAAAPNVGKTALAVQFGVDIVENNTDSCFVFLSLEMNRWDILSRIKCRLAKLDWKTLVFGSQPDRGRAREAFYSSAEWKRLQEAEKKLVSLGKRIYILDEQNFPNPTIENVINQLNTIKSLTQTKKAFLLIDYLQVWPIPKTETSIRSELEADKWRIGAMKTLRDANRNDAILVISEARKPSNNDKVGWGGDLADIMGSARGSYTPDIVFILKPFNNEELSSIYSLGLKPSEDQLTLLKEKLRQQGLAHNKLIIAKGRDGVLRETINLSFWFRESSFTENFDE